jgi:hypothetical protein
MRPALVLAVLGLTASACTAAVAPVRTDVVPASGVSPPDRNPELEALIEAAPPRSVSPVVGTNASGRAFDWWDRDGDGRLTEDELTDTWVARLDLNGDGAVERSEWPAG